VDEALYRHIGAAPHSQALVLTGDFNHAGVCWWDNTAGHKQYRRLLECVDDNFLLQVYIGAHDERWYAGPCSH